MNEMKNTIASCNSRLNSTEEIIYEPEDISYSRLHSTEEIIYELEDRSLAIT